MKEIVESYQVSAHRKLITMGAGLTLNQRGNVYSFRILFPQFSILDYK